MKKFLFIFLLLGTVFSFQGCNKTVKLDEISKNLSTYSINICYDNSTKSAKCNETYDYINTTNSILTNLKFHLYPKYFEEGNENYIVSSINMNKAYPNGKSYGNFNITRAKINDKDVEFDYSGEVNDILVIILDNSLLPNEKILVYLEFELKLPNISHRFGYSENTVNLCNFYPLLCVFENGEFNTSPYNSNGDPFYSECANYDVKIKTDIDFIIAGTGEKSENENGELKTTNFKAKAIRDFALVLSKNFKIACKKIDNTQIAYYYFADDKYEKSLKAGIDAIITFSKKFGKYPYSTFSIVQADFVYGGMEYPNLIMISDNIEDTDDYLNVIIHETAHQWWYGMVGNDEFNYPWLDEALTEYSTVLFYDYNDGYNFTHKQMVDNCKENYSMFISIYNDVLGQIDTSMRAVDLYDTEPEYTYCTYVKGVLMFDSLYTLMGEKKFINSLQSYFKNYCFKNATPNNLADSFKENYTNDIDSFFSSWIKGKVVIR